MVENWLLCNCAVFMDHCWHIAMLLQNYGESLPHPLMPPACVDLCRFCSYYMITHREWNMKSPPSDLELWACVIDRHILLMVPVQWVTLDLEMLWSISSYAWNGIVAYYLLNTAQYTLHTDYMLVKNSECTVTFTIVLWNAKQLTFLKRKKNYHWSKGII